MHASNRFLLLSTSVFLAACAATVQAEDRPSQAGQTQGSGKSVAPADRTFMTTAAGSGLYEVEVSKLAAGKATNPDLKKYAEMLVGHHTAANDELKALAAMRGVDLPTDLPADKKAKISALEKMSGQTFDKSYVQKVGIDDHQVDIMLFEKAAQGAIDAEVKAFASKTLPFLKQHLTGAKDLSKNRALARSVPLS